jgi:hypothetical protein
MIQQNYDRVGRQNYATKADKVRNLISGLMQVGLDAISTDTTMVGTMLRPVLPLVITQVPKLIGGINDDDALALFEYIKTEFAAHVASIEGAA